MMYLNDLLIIIIKVKGKQIYQLNYYYLKYDVGRTISAVVAPAT